MGNPLPLFCLMLACVPALCPWAEPPVEATVAHVIDGDTLALETGERVRLLDINAPELAHNGDPAEPFGETAKQGLSMMVSGRKITLETGPQPYDRYGRILAHVYLADGPNAGGWVNGGMVRAGLAHLYTFADNALYAPQLALLENDARTARRGLWRLDRWQVRNALACCADEDIGRFILVQGTVRHTATLGARGAKQRIFLNFGDDYTTDTSVEIRGKDRSAFDAAGIDDPAAFYAGKTVLVRGVATPVNGVMIRATHPDQLTVLTESRP